VDLTLVKTKTYDMAPMNVADAIVCLGERPCACVYVCMIVYMYMFVGVYSRDRPFS
jgi:hypothetical protein